MGKIKKKDKSEIEAKEQEQQRKKQKEEEKERLEGELKDNVPDQSLPAVIEELEKIKKVLGIKDITLNE